MSEGLNQYVVYRLKRADRETRILRHQSYQYLQDHRLKVVSDNYDQLYLARFDPSLSPLQLRRQLEKELPAGMTGQALEIGDVLSITRDGITKAYYVDPEKLITLSGFFHVDPAVSSLSLETTDYTIEGRPGLWLAAEEMWIDGQLFLMMQSQQYGKKAGYAVLDSRGNEVAQDSMEGFSEETIRQIREHIRHSAQSHKPLETQSTPAPNSIPENSPVGSDSAQTNAPPNETDNSVTSRSSNTQTEKRKKKRSKRNKKGYIPLRHRESVLKRLRQYQKKLSMERSQSTTQSE